MFARTEPALAPPFVWERRAADRSRTSDGAEMRAFGEERAQRGWATLTCFGCATRMWALVLSGEQLEPEPRAESAEPGGQLHLDLLASRKLLKELITLPAAPVTVAMLVGEGLDSSALTAVVSESTEDLIALVWFGKSPLAWLITVLASVWMFVNAASKAPIPLLGVRLVTCLIEFSRLVRAEQ